MLNSKKYPSIDRLINHAYAAVVGDSILCPMFSSDDEQSFFEIVGEQRKKIVNAIEVLESVTMAANSMAANSLKENNHVR